VLRISGGSGADGHRRFAEGNAHAASPLATTAACLLVFVVHAGVEGILNLIVGCAVHGRGARSSEGWEWRMSRSGSGARFIEDDVAP
jgi:hypothetical protein